MPVLTMNKLYKAFWITINPFLANSSYHGRLRYAVTCPITTCTLEFLAYLKALSVDTLAC